MSVDAEVQRRVLNERRALRIVGVCFLLLAAYIAYGICVGLRSRRAPEHSLPGIILACVSLVVMPLSPEPSERWGMPWAVPPCTRTRATSSVHIFGHTPGRSSSERGLRPVAGDPVAGLIMVPIMAKEGVDGVQGKACKDCCAG